MKKFLLLLLLVISSGCKQFETQKVSSEELLREESASLNWHEVDQYPAFEECREFLQEETAKACFGQRVAEYVYARLADKKPVVTEPINDTILLHLLISSQGVPSIETIEMDSSLIRQLPLLNTWIQESIDSLPEIDPASKRGIPVSTKFRMPVVIQTD